MKLLLDIAYCWMRVVPGVGIVADILDRIQNRALLNAQSTTLERLDANIEEIKLLLAQRDAGAPGLRNQSYNDVDAQRHLTILPGAFDPGRSRDVAEFLSNAHAHQYGVSEDSASYVSIVASATNPVEARVTTSVAGRLVEQFGRTICGPQLIVEQDAIVIALRTPRRLDGVRPASFRRIIVDERKNWKDFRA